MSEPHGGRFRFSKSLPRTNLKRFTGLGRQRALGIGYSRRHLYTMENERKFPRRVVLGENRVGWIESEIDGWIALRAAMRAA